MPHSIGVFDTVASLASPVAIAGMIAAGALMVGVLAAALSLFWLSFTAWSAIFLGLAVAAAAICYLFDHIKMPGALPGFSFLKNDPMDRISDALLRLAAVSKGSICEARAVDR